MASVAPPLLDSQTYYFRVGRGRSQDWPLGSAA